MVDPINYMAAVPQVDFLRNIQGGLQLGSALRQISDQRQMAAQYRSDVNSAMSDPTPQKFTALALKYPQQAENIRGSWSQLNEAQRAVELKESGEFAAALHSGKPEIAKSLLQSRIAAMKNSGKDTTSLDAISALIDNDPKKAYAATLQTLAFIPGGDKVLSNLASIGAENRAQELQSFDLKAKEGAARKAMAESATAEAAVPFAPQVAAAAATEAVSKAQKSAVEARYAEKKTQADIANVVSQNSERWARLALDKDRLMTETQLKLKELQGKTIDLPDDARKIVNESAAMAVASQQSAQQISSLASKLEKETSAGLGAFTSAGEWLKKTTGNQDSMTGLRQEYTRLMMQGVMKMLPPGPATDKDVALAMEGFPKANADAAYLTSFLRGMAKISAMDAALGNAKSEWVSANRTLGPARADIDVYGVKVPKGSTFSDFSAQFMKSKADDILKTVDVQGRDYMKYAKPQGDR